MSDEHIRHLADLCRICGEKLAKSKGSKESSYLCSSNVQFIQDNFGISVEKDIEEVHPPRFLVHEPEGVNGTTWGDKA